MSRRVLVVAGGTGRFSGRVVQPLVERLLEEGCTVVLASAAPVPAEVLDLEGLEVVSLRPSRWVPGGVVESSGLRNIRGATRARRAFQSVMPHDFSARASRKLNKWYPEYLVGAQTWRWVRRSDATLESAAGADMLVAADGDSVRAVWELGQRHAEPASVLGLSGAEAVLDAWRRASGS